MNDNDADTSSFIIRTWIEEPADQHHGTHWRGHITHVGTGKRQYFQKLEVVTDFIWSYLEEMGVPAEQR